MSGRYREAREYIGLTLTDAAFAAGIDPEKVSRIEGGDLSPTPSEMLCFSTIYQRPPFWLRGDLHPPVEISAELDELMEKSRVSERDRREIVQFVEFLRHRAKPEAG